MKKVKASAKGITVDMLNQVITESYSAGYRAGLYLNSITENALLDGLVERYIADCLKKHKKEVKV